METLRPFSGDGTGNTGQFEIGVAGRALAGETVSGDMHFVVPVAAGTLIGVVDGLGHGEEAAHAAESAIACVKSHAEQDLSVIMERCHCCLVSTRGVVMSVALFESARQTLHWLGVGNVEGVVVRAGSVPQSAHYLPCRGGVV